MPGRDRTGPWGYGSISGKGMGSCGHGLGHFMHGMLPGFKLTKQQEIEHLKSHKKFAEDAIQEINERLKDLEDNK
jgi:hypothetical protein